VTIYQFVRTAIAHYGKEHQMVKGAEECNELGQQYCKAALNQATRPNLVEEMADVLLMIEQAKYAYSITDTEINQVVRAKIERQLERIEAEKARLKTPLGKIGDRRAGSG